MRDRIQKLQEKIDEIEILKGTLEWGAEYQIWIDRTERLVKEEYGDEASGLFKRQNSVVLDDEAYLRELEGRKKILEGFIRHNKEYKPKARKQAKETSSNTSSPLTIHGDFIAGDKIGRDKNTSESTEDIPLLFKWVVGIVAVLTFVWTIYIYFNPSGKMVPMVSSSALDLNKSGLSTTTPNLADIFLKTNSMLDLDKENFLKDFNDGPVYTTGASFENINSSGEGFIVRMTVERNAVGCAFGVEFRKELLLLKNGDKVDFYGIFTGGGLGGYGAVNPWYITDCILLK